MKEEIKQGTVSTHSTTAVENGYYIERGHRIEIKKAILVEVVDGLASVTHTGAYGQIKFEWDGETWQSQNPYSSNRQDNRITRQVIATNLDKTRVIDMKHLHFTFSADTMSTLHSTFYIPKKNKDAYWVELPTNLHKLST